MISSAKTAFALLLCTILLGTSAFARSSGVRNKWQDISSSLLKKCYALPYHGGKRVNWCSCLKGNKCPTAQFPARCIKRFTGKLK